MLKLDTKGKKTEGEDTQQQKQQQNKNKQKTTTKKQKEEDSCLIRLGLWRETTKKPYVNNCFDVGCFRSVVNRNLRFYISPEMRSLWDPRLLLSFFFFFSFFMFKLRVSKYKRHTHVNYRRVNNTPGYWEEEKTEEEKKTW